MRVGRSLRLIPTIDPTAALLHGVSQPLMARLAVKVGFRGLDYPAQH